MFPLLLADVQQTVTIEVRDETRGRMVQTSGVLVAPLSKEASFSPTAKTRIFVVDNELQPLIKYKANTAGKRTSLTLQYNPRLVFTNLAGKDEPYSLVYTGDRLASDAGKLDTVHQGLLLWEHQIEPRTRVAFVISGLYGSASANTLVVPQRWDGEGLPAMPRAVPLIPQIRFDILGGYANLAFGHALSTRTQIQLQLYAMSYGTPTSEGREFFPTYRNAGLMATLVHSLTRRDDLEVSISPEVTQTQPVGAPHPDAYTSFAWARYRRKFNDRTRAEIAAGGSLVALGAFGPEAQAAKAYPAGEALLAHSRMRGAARNDLVLATRVVPWVNPLTGEIVSRSESVFGLRAGDGHVGVRAQGGFAWAFAPEVLSAEANPVRYSRSYRMLSAEAAIEGKLGSDFWLDAGPRLSCQTSVTNIPALPSDTLQLGGFVGLSYRPTPPPAAQ